MTTQREFATVNEHSLPYRVLIAEIRQRHGDSSVAPGVDDTIAELDACYANLREYERKDVPDLEEYRRIQEKCAGLEIQIKEILHKANLSALCFSGGGIRSASFGLGVLTKLAALSIDDGDKNKNGGQITEGEQKEEQHKKWLMDEIDYVSTVSGGGYIGSWFTGWICRHPQGFRGVLRDLARFRLTSTDPEAPPVRHLRDYTSYLAPHTGLLSPDSWTLAAIFLRNLILNWAILVPSFAALLVLPILNTYLFNWTRTLSALWLLRLAAALAFIGLFVTGLNLPGNYRRQPRTSRKAHFAWVLVPLLLSAWCLSAGFLSGSAYTNFEDHFLLLWIMSGVVHAALFLVRFFYSKRHDGKAADIGPTTSDFWGQVMALAGSSAFAAWILWLLATHVGKNLLAGNDIRWFTSLAVPLVLGSYAMTAVLLNGLSAKFDLEEDREWWSRSGAFILMFVVIWPLAHLIVLYNREIVAAATYVFFGKESAGAASIPVLAGIIGALASWIGFTPATPSAHAKLDEKKLSGISKVLVKRDLVIPALGVFFFIILAIALAQAIDWLARWIADTNCTDPICLWALWSVFGGAAGLAVLMNVFVNVNTFSLHAMYRGRLVRSYLGASNNVRRPNPFTNFDANDNFPFACADEPRCGKMENTRKEDGKLGDKKEEGKSGKEPEQKTVEVKKPGGPLHIVNIALNVVATKKLAWQQRKAESYTASRIHCGSFRVGYRPTSEYAGKDGLTLGTAMAISGAAASPNMGYHSSPILTLVMTFFNARLGWWLPNPGLAGESAWEKTSPRFSLLPLLNEALGKTTDEDKWVYLSDGGHFENLGLYEMVLRRCKRIIVVDGGADPDFTLEDLGNAVRKINIDLGVPITFDPPVAFQKGANHGNRHYFIGRVHYSHADLEPEKLNRLCELEAHRNRSETLKAMPSRSPEEENEYRDLTQRATEGSPEQNEYKELVSIDGVLIYIKASLNGNEPVDVTEYSKSHPDFPHESTANQFFNESQFESYVRLGMHVVDEITTPKASSPRLAAVVGPLTLQWTAPGILSPTPPAALIGPITLQEFVDVAIS